MRTFSFFLFAAVCSLTFMAWSTDSVTVEGHWTVYTASCDGGHWDGAGCTGRLVAAERHRFVTEPKASLVAYEIVGNKSATGRLSQCAIQDGRNWACQKCNAAVCPITFTLTRGEPQDGANSVDGARPISKLKWFGLKLTG